ncbi:Endonuclease/exonuclease/phosphatase [Mycena epipterygia]|nr:Endonuclease/exonuclease/phosphatase [Mycena epipterygia]
MSLWTSLFRSSQTIPSRLYSYDPLKTLWSLTTSPPSSEPPTQFSIISWNIDFAAPLVVRRFQTALTHLEKILSPHISSPPPPPTIILLQEVHTSCFQPLLSNPFIREFYQLSNISSRQSYSTLTLVPNSLAAMVSSVLRTPFPVTRMERDCVYVDLDIPSPESAAKPKFMRLRIANTHLESLRGFGDTARPKQLKFISKLLTAPEIDGGLVAGDMNCISPSDHNLPEQVGLSDVWLTVKNKESGTDGDAEEGHTWGYQPKSKFPAGRLDKILTVGKIDAVEIQRVGVGLRVDGSQDRSKDTWVSDHYGLLAKIVLRP